jgi:prevent-host-death family protein
MPVLVNIHEAKTHLSRLVQRAADGEDIVIAKAGAPMVRLVPYRPEAKPRVPGAWKGKGWIADDFDEPLPDDLLAAFYGDVGEGIGDEGDDDGGADPGGA